jgi:hypothetical protein
MPVAYKKRTVEFSYSCELCHARGWILVGREGYDWAKECSVCSGIGRLDFFQLAKLLDEDPDTLERTFLLRSRPATAWRIFCKVWNKCIRLDPRLKSSVLATSQGLDSGPLFSS